MFYHLIQDYPTRYSVIDFVSIIHFKVEVLTAPVRENIKNTGSVV